MDYICVLIGFITGILLGFIINKWKIRKKTVGILKIVASEDNELLLELNKQLDDIKDKDRIVLKIENFYI